MFSLHTLIWSMVVSMATLDEEGEVRTLLNIPKHLLLTNHLPSISKTVRRRFSFFCFIDIYYLYICLLLLFEFMQQIPDWSTEEIYICKVAHAQHMRWIWIFKYKIRSLLGWYLKININYLHKIYSALLWRVTDWNSIVIIVISIITHTVPHTIIK